MFVSVHCLSDLPTSDAFVGHCNPHVVALQHDVLQLKRDCMNHGHAQIPNHSFYRISEAMLFAMVTVTAEAGGEFGA